VNRRNFLQMLGLVVPAAAVAPDLARRYFFAPRGGWLLAKSGPPYTFSNGVYSLGGLTSLWIEYDELRSIHSLVGSPFALYDQNGVRVGKGQLVPLDRAH
jgi:hypothetical protein